MESNLKMIQRTSSQNRNRLTNFKNKFMVTKVEKGRGQINKEFGVNMHTTINYL